MDDTVIIFLATQAVSIIIGLGTVWKLVFKPLWDGQKQTIQWRSEIEHEMKKAKEDIKEVKDSLPMQRIAEMDKCLMEIKTSMARFDERQKNMHDKIKSIEERMKKNGGI